jgi:hypothetical protein
MAKKQTRKSVSISEGTYKKLHAYAINTGVSMSSVLEKLIEAFFKGETPRADETAPPGDTGNVRFF